MPPCTFMLNYLARDTLQLTASKCKFVYLRFLLDLISQMIATLHGKGLGLMNCRSPREQRDKNFLDSFKTDLPPPVVSLFLKFDFFFCASGLILLIRETKVNSILKSRTQLDKATCPKSWVCVLTTVSVIFKVWTISYSITHTHAHSHTRMYYIHRFL